MKSTGISEVSSSGRHSYGATNELKNLEDVKYDQEVSWKRLFRGQGSVRSCNVNLSILSLLEGPGRGCSLKRSERGELRRFIGTGEDHVEYEAGRST